MEYSKAVDEYSDVIGKGEMGKRPEVEKKIKSFMSKWTEMEMEFGSELTPQELNKLDKEYQNIIPFPSPVRSSILIFKPIRFGR